jgi:hypothetical protein
MPSLGIVPGGERTTDERLIRGSSGRWVYKRATNECEIPPLDIGVQAIQLSPYRSGVAGLQHTRLLLSPAFQPCACPLALSGPGQAVASESSALNSDLLWRQFTPCVTRRTLSAHPALRGGLSHTGYNVALVMNSSHSWLVHSCGAPRHPLRSRSVTDPSTLLRGDPPLCLASVLRPLWVLHLGGSLGIEATGSQVTHLSQKRTHATFTPDATLPVSGCLQH